MRHKKLYSLKGSEKIFGCKAEEIIGKSLDILIPERYIEAHSRHVEEFEKANQGKVDAWQTTDVVKMAVNFPPPSPFPFPAF
ncbi:MAG: hypothetical protein NZ901_09700 [Geminocystis sp.]|nr:hypothetical protein [Geminocystis sp.]HIK37162.1 hypothetical protein [Geminocystis sp. M7585_C2015_104]MCS7148447.1 hypothetical protein [Geminocystis sp.]MCX8078238.1 hypothetical protein [Geminocystis sp.]MDW8115966.1 hypothetical protein [Geminocystis sp.]